MDALDFRILTALFVDPRQSYRSLGRQVKLSAPAVRDRIQRLQRVGILRGFVLTPEPSVFGRENRVVLFQGNWPIESASRALTLPDVAWVAWKADGGLTVQLWPRPGSDSLSALTKTLGTPPFFQTVSPAPTLRPVSILDWRIIETLLEDPRMALVEVVERSRLSSKTVRRRLLALLRDRIIAITPRLGSLADSGDLVFTISVLGRIGAGEVREILGEASLLRRLPDPPAQYFLSWATDLGEVTQRIKRLQEHPEVEASFVSLNRDQFVNLEFLRTLVREQMRSSVAASTPSEQVPRRIARR